MKKLLSALIGLGLLLPVGGLVQAAPVAKGKKKADKDDTKKTDKRKT